MIEHIERLKVRARTEEDQQALGHLIAYLFSSLRCRYGRCCISIDVGGEEKTICCDSEGECYVE
jgi:hypothetical protein